MTDVKPQTMPNTTRLLSQTYGVLPMASATGAAAGKAEFGGAKEGGLIAGLTYRFDEGGLIRGLRRDRILQAPRMVYGLAEAA